MNFTIRQLQAFVLVSQLGSFTKAAKSMHLTQSALSVLIRELENTVGTRLIDRTTRSLSITTVGKEFLVGAERILGDIDHAVTNINLLMAQEKGRVVVAAPLVLSSTFLPRIVVGFKAQYPGIEFVLKDALPDEVLPQVRNNIADVGIGTFRRTEPELDRVQLFKESLVAIFPKDHPFSKVRTLTWHHLEGTPLLLLPRSSVFRELAERGFATAGLTLEPAFESNYVGTMIGLASVGLGVAIVPGYATALADKATTCWKPLNRPVVYREVSIVHRADISVSPAVQAFIDFVVPSNKSPLR